MATYVIGDIQGCFRTLRALLRRIRFVPGRDRLWLVGDLVNRGPGSLSVLKWAAENDPHIVAVLGNHDLHLLAAAAGERSLRPRDTLDDILESPDREQLVHWLRQRPLLHRDGNTLMVHAGILPAWTLEDALQKAREAERALRGPDANAVLAHMNRRSEDRWSEELEGRKRINAILQVLTRMRTCTVDGRLCLDYNGPPAEAPPDCLPWFSVPERQTGGLDVFFGHWAALGLYQAPGVSGLESGCVWGGPLTALRLEDRKVFQEPCAEPEIVG